MLFEFLGVAEKMSCQRPSLQMVNRAQWPQRSAIVMCCLIYLKIYFYLAMIHLLT